MHTTSCYFLKTLLCTKCWTPTWIFHFPRCPDQPIKHIRIQKTADGEYFLARGIVFGSVPVCYSRHGWFLEECETLFQNVLQCFTRNLPRNWLRKFETTVLFVTCDLQLLIEHYQNNSLESSFPLVQTSLVTPCQTDIDKRGSFTYLILISFE